MLSSLAAAGCATAPLAVMHEKTIGNSTTEVDRIARAIDRNVPEVFSDVAPAQQPLTTQQLQSVDSYQDLKLEQILAQGLGSASVLRDVGGAVLRAPDSMATSVSRQLAQTDPRYGTEAALSAFDAQLAAAANFNKNDRIYNNSFFAGGATAFLQDYHDYQVELSKRSAAGSLMALRGVSNYDNNNAPANNFASSWNSWIEGEIRQPLLQGGGLEFNRIAGPNSTPGSYNGIMIAKVNSDMTDVDFQVALRDYVSNVENAYWDLYLAWRDYDAKRQALAEIEQLYDEKYGKLLADPKARDTVNAVDAAYVRQQMLQLKNEAREALHGRLLNGTEVRNGSSGGTMQNTSGVLAAERRLRLLIGLPATDGKVIRPSDEPTTAEFAFSWDLVTAEALAQRPELQRSNLAVKKRELELLAAKNFLNPKLDAVGRYRFRGFGDSLIAGGNQGGGSPASSIGNLAEGDQQEWAVGVEMTIPIGYRKAHAAVSHAELNLMRERSIQREQQREVLSNLTGAWGDKDRAYESMKTALEQYLAAREYVDGIVSREETPDDRKIDGWRRLAQAESLLFRARAEYAVALKNIHYEKGSILEYKNMRVQTPEVHQPTPITPPAPPQTPAEMPQTGRQVPFSAGTAGLDSPKQKVVPAVGVSLSSNSRPAAKPTTSGPEPAAKPATSAKAGAEVQPVPEEDTRKSSQLPNQAAKQPTSAAPAHSGTPWLSSLHSIAPLRSTPKERLHSRVNPETPPESHTSPAGKSKTATASLDDTPAPAPPKSSKPNVAGRASL
ncbi:MAG: hypothetical protein RLZZ436_313 [Planctomycetota bacterium]|jgi:hypothetical protein